MSDTAAPKTVPINTPQAEAIATAVDNALPASLKGRAQIYAASGAGAVILIAIQHFQPRYYPWLTPSMAETAAGLLGIGVMLTIHEITRTAVFRKLQQCIRAHNQDPIQTTDSSQP